MNPTAPRVYVYRKSGRTVWDVEIWLPDGTRKTWRSGLEDREAALSAGFDHAQALMTLPDAGGPDSPTVTTEAPMATALGDEDHQTLDTPRGAPVCGQATRSSRSFQNLLQRFDRWFWAQIGQG
jgi:hypothetical protein